MLLQSIAPGGKAIFVLVALFAIGSVLFLLNHLIRNPDLVKAKLFLNYERFSRYVLLIFVAVLAGVGVNLALTLGRVYVDASFESWDAFFRNKAFTLSIFAGIGAGCLGFRKMLK
ncbi:MAG: hypothetical protein QXT68_08090 [Halobacteria archaeon]